jgi:hypothetical protein
VPAVKPSPRRRGDRQRVTKAYQMDPVLNDRLLRYARENRYAVGICLEFAIEEFLEKREGDEL